MQRKRRFLFPLISIVLCFSAFSHSQSWSSILAPSRGVDWTNAGVPGGIPSGSWTKCGSTINAYNGTAAAINNALSACSSNQYVKLGVGTFNLTTGIRWSKSNVALSGSGADQTKLIFTGSDGCHGFFGAICMIDNSGLDVNSATVANVTAGLSKGSTVLTLSSVTGLSAGMFVGMDQLDNAATDTNQMWICEVADTCVDEGSSGGQRGGDLRGQMQYFKIVSVDTTAKTITVSTPIYMPNWRTGQSPQVFWLPNQVSQMGVEDLSMDWTGSSSISGIQMFNCNACWISGIRLVTLAASGNGSFDVRMFNSSFVTIRDSYIYGSQRAMTTSYGIDPYMTSNDLIENNFFQHQASPIVFNGGGAGSVVAYNYSYDNYWQVNPTGVAGQIWMHAAGADMVLIEGNDGQAWFSDDIHGTHVFDTLFRNRYTGTDPADPARVQQAFPVSISAFGRYDNIIGNVFGTSGFHNIYQCQYPSNCPNPNHIYDLGYANNQPLVPPGDVLGGTTSVMRWGNYDVVNGGNRFVDAEVPSSFNDGSGSPSLYVNPVPASQTLPASFYLSSKPFWFGSAPWPPIGPDIAGGDIPGVAGHANRIPARVCFEALANDPAYAAVRIFNAASCYTGNPPPGPPTGLSAAVQ